MHEIELGDIGLDVSVRRVLRTVVVGRKKEHSCDECNRRQQKRSQEEATKLRI